MNEPDLEPCDSEELLSLRDLIPSPRILIATGLTFQLGAMLVFWPLPLGFILTAVGFYPVTGTICVLLAASVTAWLTRLTWRRGTWVASSFYFLGCIVTLPWTFIVIFAWPHPT